MEKVVFDASTEPGKCLRENDPTWRKNYPTKREHEGGD